MMGGKRDLEARDGSKRQADDSHRRTIESARNLIYDQNYAVNSASVERIVAETSLVPTRVRLFSTS
jgi:hypothetical protein